MRIYASTETTLQESLEKEKQCQNYGKTPGEQNGEKGLVKPRSGKSTAGQPVMTLYWETVLHKDLIFVSPRKRKPRESGLTGNS